MKFFVTLWATALMAMAPYAHGQSVPPLDHIVVNDPRIFDLSDAGAGYALEDGPVASAMLSLVQGPKGAIAASVVISDDHMTSWGPVVASGKLKVSGTNPLSLRLKSHSKGMPRISITGNYDASVRLMRVLVKVKTPEGQSFQWNDAFVPDNATSVGLAIDRAAVVSNGKNVIKGSHVISVPGAVPLLVRTTDREIPNTDFKLQGKGVNIMGDYNPATMSFSVFQSKVSVGYGTIFTPGSLVIVTSDNSFLRVF